MFHRTDLPIERLEAIMAGIKIIEPSFTPTPTSQSPTSQSPPVGTTHKAPSAVPNLPVGMTVESLRIQEEKLVKRLRDYTKLEAQRKAGEKLNSVEVSK